MNREREKLNIYKTIQKPQKFIRKGFEIEIISMSEENEMLKIIATAWKNGKRVFVDNPLYYKNPPIQVPVGKKKIKLEGKDVEVDEFMVNPDEALKEMVADTIRILNT